MAREIRVFDPDLLYHVVAKGNNGGWIVRDVDDRQLFTWRMDRVATAYHWEMFAWCLMKNHAHWVLRAREDTISAGMQELIGGHARTMNRRHGRSGHLFRNRFFSTAIETDAHAVASIAYVNHNPDMSRCQTQSRKCKGSKRGFRATSW